MFKRVEIPVLTVLSIITMILLVFTASCATKLAYRDYDDNNYEIIYNNESPENINGLFPDRIFIKTKTQTFNSIYEFQLYNGKIYYKGLKGKTPNVWTILKNSGLPENHKEKGFIIPSAIEEISADSSNLYALSYEGIFYSISFESSMMKFGEQWVQNIGFPYKYRLRLPDELKNKRSWAMSRRGPEVLWYEDINGNQHHYGTIGIITNYILLEDGCEIRFADPGLPSDFSHNILGPERGAFIAESLSASASTIFLINSAGEMYTRLADFDTVGSDPMFFKYTYDRQYSDPRPGSDYDTNFNYWALPAEDWYMQPNINGGRLTSRITILQNGRGNEKRELRVGAVNSAGRTGYYYKQLYDSEWKFQPAELKFAEQDFIEFEPPAPRGVSPDRSLSGFLWLDGKLIDGLSIEVHNFNLFEGEAILRVVSGDHELEMDFYPVEMWYYFKRGVPGRDGAPKLFMATIDMRGKWVDGLSEYFSIFDKQIFAFTAEASEDYLVIESVDKNSSRISMILTEDDISQFNCDILRLKYYVEHDNIVSSFFSDEFRIKTELDHENLNGNSDFNSSGKFIAAAERNKLLLDRLKTAYAEFDGKKRSSKLSKNTYNSMEKFLKATGLDSIDYPKIKTVTMYSGVILETIDNMERTSAENKRRLYKYMIDHSQRRIDYCEAIAKGSDALPVFFERPSEYLRLANIEFNQNYKLKDGREIELYTKFLDIYPLIVLGDSSADRGYLIDFYDFEQTLASYITGGRSGGLKIAGKMMDYFGDTRIAQDVSVYIGNGSLKVVGGSDMTIFETINN